MDGLSLLFDGDDMSAKRVNDGPGGMDLLFGEDRPKPNKPKGDTLAQWADQQVAEDLKNKKTFLPSNFVRGFPIVGGLIDEGTAGIEAGIRALTGDERFKTYDKALAYHRARNRAADANETSLGDWPLVGEVTTGGIKKLAGGLMAAPVAPLAAPLKGASLAAKAGNAALNGLIYGAGHGAAEAEGGAANRAVGASIGGAFGLGLGLATPVAARGLSNAATAIANKVRPTEPALKGMHPKAVKIVRDTLDDDGITNSYTRQSRDLGQEAMLADMGEAARLDAAAVARLPGAPRAIGQNAVQRRAAESADRIRNATDDVLGPAENTVSLENNVVGQAQRNAKPLYDQFRMTEVPITENMTKLLERAQSVGAFDKARKLLQAEGVDVNSTKNDGVLFDAIKRAVDDLSSAAPPRSNEQRIFSSLAKDIRDEIDNALSPGDPSNSIYAQARRASGEGLQFREGLEQGQKAFDRGVHPDQLAVDLRGMSEIKKAGFQAGARAQIRDIMGNSGTQFGPNGQSAAMRKLGSEYARQKINLVRDNPQVVVGTQRAATPQTPLAPADRLINRLDTEATFNRTRDLVSGNSVTSQVQAAQKKFPTPGENNNIIGDSLWSDTKRAAVKVADAIAGDIMNQRRTRIATDAARMYFAQGGDRNALADALIRLSQRRGLSNVRRERLEYVANALQASIRQPAISEALAD